MKIFDLELRVKTFGSIITWKVFLEDSTNNNNIVRDWLQSEDGFRYKKLPGYKIEDDSLEVFAGCHGIEGGRLTCEVIINEKTETKKITAKVEEKVFAKGTYKIN